MEFVYIKPGTFIMGSPPKLPGRVYDETQHKVTLVKGYYIQTTEVTQSQWAKVMDTCPWFGKVYVLNSGNNPAVHISWNDAQKLIQKLNQQENDGKYRLPTESEWEYACRAGSRSQYYFGDSKKQLGEYAWHSDNVWSVNKKYAHPVAQKKPNAWGLYDMHGNVWEWCHDWFNDYPLGAVNDPAGPDSGVYRVRRGGGWDNRAAICRSAFRSGSDPDIRSSGLGLRLVKNE